MKKTALLLMFVLSQSAQAALFPTQSEYYYDLGGTSTLFIPPVHRDETISIGGNVNLGGLLNCNYFNPVVTITNSLNDLSSSVSGIPSNVIDNLRGAVAGFALYKLQQSMPGLYNVVQNTSFGAQNEFALKVADCGRAKENLESGNSPLDSFLSVSDSQGWVDSAKRALQGESVDITKTSKDHAKLSESYGIPWVHRHQGNAGGKNQVPIKVINDVVIAGYNLMLEPSRSLDDLSAPLSSAVHHHPFERYWSSPDDAARWAVLVIGDIHVSARPEMEAKATKAGLGLVALLESCPRAGSSTTCVANVADFVWKLVDGSQPLTELNLRKISAANLFVTEDIITSIQRLNKEEQLLTVSKLSQDIAIQNVLDEALLLRRVLQTGFQIQEVQNLQPAQNMITTALKRLDKDIHSLAFESEVRKKMMTQTLQRIMQRRTNDLSESLGHETQGDAIIKQGAIYQKPKDQ